MKIIPQNVEKIILSARLDATLRFIKKPDIPNKIIRTMRVHVLRELRETAPEILSPDSSKYIGSLTSCRTLSLILDSLEQKWDPNLIPEFWQLVVYSLVFSRQHECIEGHMSARWIEGLYGHYLRGEDFTNLKLKLFYKPTRYIEGYYRQLMTDFWYGWISQL